MEREVKNGLRNQVKAAAFDALLLQTKSKFQMLWLLKKLTVNVNK
jgi:hypothetical protein